MEALVSDLSSEGEALFVEFYTNKTEEYDGQVFVKIMAPGDKTNIYDQPMREDHKARFPKQWIRFLQNDPSVKFVGTPLGQWHENRPMDMTGDQLSELVAMGFQTVEQVAQASDSQMAKVGMGAITLRERARAELKRMASRNGDTEKEDLRREIEELKAGLRALQTIKTPDDPPIPRGPGRPKKELVDAVNDAPTDGANDE
jgi:hypothetical protein